MRKEQLYLNLALSVYEICSYLLECHWRIETNPFPNKSFSNLKIAYGIVFQAIISCKFTLIPVNPLIS